MKVAVAIEEAAVHPGAAGDRGDAYFGPCPVKDRLRGISRGRRRERVQSDA